MANTADGALVEAARAGDQRAFGQLFDGWFDRVNDVSRRIVHDDGLAGEITQDTFLMAWTKLDTLQDVDAFGGWVLRIGRNTSLNRLARERRSVSMDDEAMTVALDANAPDHDPLADMDQAGRISLVWDAAAALGPRDQSVLDLHLRHGLSATELAGELGTTPNNAHQILFTLKKRLGNSVRALVLWRAGHPTCPDLRQGLSVAGLTSFGAPMVKAIDAHVDSCATCSEDRTERLNPAALFAAAPVIAAGTLVKAKAAAALTQAGVPMSGSASAAAAGSTGAAGGSVGSSGSALGTGAPDPSLAPGSSPSGGMGGAVGGGPGGPTAFGAGAGAGAGAGGAGGATAENVVSFPPAPDGLEGRSRSLANRRVLAAAVVLALVAIGLAVVLAGRGDSDDRVSTDVAAPPTTAGTSAKHSSTTDQPATSITTTTNIPDGTLRVIPRTTVPGSGDPGTTPPATVPTNTTPGTPTIPLTPGKPAPTTPPPTTTPGVDKPTILRFSVRSTPYACEEGYRWTLSWATLRADTVTVGWMQTPGQIGPADGKATICAPRNSTFFINADGPGGRTSLTVQGEGPTPETTTTTVPPTTQAPVTKPTRPPGQTG